MYVELGTFYMENPIIVQKRKGLWLILNCCDVVIFPFQPKFTSFFGPGVNAEIREFSYASSDWHNLIQYSIICIFGFYSFLSKQSEQKKKRV